MPDSALGWTLPRRHARLAVLVVILLLGTALRLYELDSDSLWGDEIFEAQNAERGLAANLSAESSSLSAST